MNYTVRTGTDISWLYNVNASYINSDYKSVSMVKDEELKRLNASASVQFNVGYEMNHRLQIGGNAFYNKQLGSNFRKYKHRFENAGLGFFVRKGF